MDQASKIVDFYNQVCLLKKLVRKGWRLRGVPNPESVAEHSFGVALLTLIYARRFELNVETALTIALLHEVGETIIGDITPHDGVDPGEKARLEDEAATRILSELDETGRLLELWHDLHYQRTAEARLVKELDRLEMALQAYWYEEDTGLVLDEFFPYVDARVDTPELRAVLKLIQNERETKR